MLRFISSRNGDDRGPTHHWIGITMSLKLLPILLVLTSMQAQDCASTILTGKCEDMKPTISLRFSEVGLQSIARNFLDSPYVSCVSLDGNEISTIKFDAFSKAPNLLYLDLSRNRIPWNELLSFNAPPSLRTLVLDGNVRRNDYYIAPSYSNMNFMPSVSFFPNLTNLYLRENDFDSLPSDLSISMPNLTHLYLDSNRIDSTSMLSSNLPRSLIYLSLRNNTIAQVQELPEHLEELFLDRNQIEFLCHFNCYDSFLSLRGFSKLRVLSLSENRITRIESSTFLDTRNLTSLDLSGNALSMTNKMTALQFLTALRNLSLANNSLTEIPDLCQIPQLRQVNFSYNYIEIVEANSFDCELELRVLDLEGNAITRIEESSFSKLANLEVLNLSNNQLKVFPRNWLPPKSSLRLLYVEKNFFDSLEVMALFNFRNITDVYVGCNPLKTLNTRALCTFTTNVTFHFETDCPNERSTPYTATA